MEWAKNGIVETSFLIVTGFARDCDYDNPNLLHALSLASNSTDGGSIPLCCSELLLADEMPRESSQVSAECVRIRTIARERRVFIGQWGVTH